MLLDYTSTDKPLRYDPLKAIVGPRPIGWISSVNPDGTTNIAPYSFFQLVSTAPGIVMFSSHGMKNTLTNIQRTGEFVCNFATEENLSQVSQSSGNYTNGAEKAQASDISFTPSGKIATPRVTGVHAAIECILSGCHSVAALTGENSDWTMVFGTVVAAYLDDQYVEEGIFQAHLLNPLLRGGYRYYTVAKDYVELSRPGE